MTVAVAVEIEAAIVNISNDSRDQVGKVGEPSRAWSEHCKVLRSQPWYNQELFCSTPARGPASLVFDMSLPAHSSRHVQAWYGPAR